MLTLVYRTPRGVSTHSRPKAAAQQLRHLADFSRVSTHSRPKAAAFELEPFAVKDFKFQHTAA